MSDRQPDAAALFADDWLRLREPLDHASRAHGLARTAARTLARQRAGREARIVDLGTGTGSNWRYLSQFLAPDSHWTLVDHDAAHLARLAENIDARYLTTRRADLAAPLAPLLEQADLVTAAALLDLVSARWIDDFSAAAAAAGTAVLMALSVDGTLRFTGEADPGDAPVFAALARDQRRDKGFGAALGTDAPRRFIDAFSRYGYAITAMPSPWHIDANHASLAEALVHGWATAASDHLDRRDVDVSAWARRRIAAVAAGRARLVVGHIDVLALPAA